MSQSDNAYWSEYYSKTIKEYIDKLLQTIKTLEEDIIKLKEEKIGKIEQLEPVFLQFNMLLAQHNNITPEECLSILEQKLKFCEAAHTRNLPKIQNNIKIRDTVIHYLSNLGLQKGYYKRKSSRSSKRVLCTSEWVISVQTLIPTTDEWSQVECDYKIYCNQIKDWQSKIEREKLAKQEQEKKDSVVLGNTQILVQVAIKYKIEIPCTAKRLLDELLNKNKYLCLAHYLQLNRNDWIEGCSYAKLGLKNFEVCTKEDQEIIDEINDLIEEWEDDGRVFRDCKYNFNWLFEKVKKDDTELFVDYLLIKTLGEIQ